MQRGHWELRITMIDDMLEPDEIDFGQIAEMIVGGYTSGVIEGEDDSIFMEHNMFPMYECGLEYEDN